MLTTLSWLASSRRRGPRWWPRMLLPLALLVVSLALIHSARADQPTASGTWELVSHTQTLLKTADGNSFFAVVESPLYSGVGTAIDTYTLIVHSDGSLNGHGTETCTGCTLGGRTGDYTAIFAFSASASGAQESRLTFTSGSGGLAGLHGGGTFSLTHTTPTVGGTFDFSYHFAP